MRELIYGVEGKSANLKTFAVDEPGHGGACHKYEITALVGQGNFIRDITLGFINFQNGPIKDNNYGVNGVQNEDLLAIVIDRLEGFQSGPYKCGDNALALDALRAAMGYLQQRTKDRIARGVEGTHTV